MASASYQFEREVRKTVGGGGTSLNHGGARYHITNVQNVPSASQVVYTPRVAAYNTGVVNAGVVNAGYAGLAQTAVGYGAYGLGGAGLYSGLYGGAYGFGLGGVAALPPTAQIAPATIPVQAGADLWPGLGYAGYAGYGLPHAGYAGYGYGGLYPGFAMQPAYAAVSAAPSFGLVAPTAYTSPAVKFGGIIPQFSYGNRYSAAYNPYTQFSNYFLEGMTGPTLALPPPPPAPAATAVVAAPPPAAIVAREVVAERSTAEIEAEAMQEEFQKLEEYDVDIERVEIPLNGKPIVTHRTERHRAPVTYRESSFAMNSQSSGARVASGARAGAWGVAPAGFQPAGALPIVAPAHVSLLAPAFGDPNDNHFNLAKSRAIASRPVFGEELAVQEFQE